MPHLLNYNPTKPLTILAVDDDASILKIYKRIFNQNSICFIEAQNGKAGIDLAIKVMPDIILLDVGLNDMNGNEVSKILKENEQTKHIPIIKISGEHTSPGDKTIGLNEGAENYLCKPLNKDELLATINAVLRTKKLENGAVELAASWQDTFDSISDAILVVSPDFRLWRYNSAASNLFGISPMDKVIQQRQIVPLSYYNAVDFLSHLINNSEKEENLKDLIFTKTAREYYSQNRNSWFKMKFNPVHSKDGHFGHSIVVIKDITERKNNEFRIQEYQKQLDLAYENTGVFDLCLRDGDLFISKTLMNLLHLGQEELKSNLSNLKNLTFKEDIEYISKVYFDVINGQNDVYDTKMRVKTKDDEVLWIRIFANIYYQKNKPYRMVGFCYDITKEVIIYQELEKEKTRQIGAFNTNVLGTMAAGLAHEMGNPLFALGYGVRYIRGKIAQGATSDENFNDFFDNIENSIKSLSDIILGIKIFARDDHEVTFRIASLFGIINNAINLCQSRFRDKGVSFLVENPENDIDIICIPGRVSQVIFSLLLNAFDAVQGQDKKEITLKTSKNGDVIKISCIDSGCGVPENITEQIMNPFFTTKEPNTGVGLGLTVAKSIIESHNGRLWHYRSEEGLTVFSFVLPLNPHEGN